jgi:hypothetical protein
MKWGNKRCILVFMSYYKISSSTYANCQMTYKSKISTIIPNLENHKFLYFKTIKWGNKRCILVLMNYYKLPSSSSSNYQVISRSNGI